MLIIKVTKACLWNLVSALSEPFRQNCGQSTKNKKTKKTDYMNCYVSFMNECLINAVQYIDKFVLRLGIKSWEWMPLSTQLFWYSFDS